MKEEQIVSSAKKLFTTYGYKRVSMDEIAKEANVTKKTIYSYFKSKEELLKFLVNQEILNMKKIADKIEDENIPYFENVHNVVYSLIEYKAKSNFLNSITKEYQIFSNITILDCLKQIDAEINEYISKKLKEAIRKKYIIEIDADMTAFIIYKMYISLMFEFNEKKINKQKLADVIVKILKDGLERKDDKVE